MNKTTNLMNFIKNLKHISLNRLFQGETNGNRKALKELKALNFTPPEIRKALIAINGINVSALKNGHSISVGTLHNTLNGTRVNELAKDLIAQALGLKVPELFPE